MAYIGPRFWLETLKALIRSPWTHRMLISQLIRRDITGRYRGSMVGLFWSLLNPMLMLGVFTFVFSVVFKARWGIEQNETKVDFALILFVGLIVHGIFSESVNRAPSLILSNANFVKKIVFPLEVLPWVAMGSTLFHATVSLIVWATFFLIAKDYLPWTMVLLPVVILPLVLLSMGLAWFLTATGVYLRDLSQMTGFLTTLLLFLSPIFYPATALPEQYRALFKLNPLTVPVEQAREILIWGRLPDFSNLAIYGVVSLVIALLGLAWFQKTRRGFADVL